MTGIDTHNCPICAVPFKPEDLCADDVTEGTCHAACLEGSPIVDLETGAEIPGGKIDTYPYSDVMEPVASAPAHSSPAEAAAHGQIFKPCAVDESGESPGFTATPPQQQYLNLVDGKIYELVSQDGDGVTFKREGRETPHYLGRAEFDRRFQLQTPPPQIHGRVSGAGKITPDMIRDTAGWSQSEDDLRETLRWAADELERALAALPAPQDQPIGFMDVDRLGALVDEVRARPAASPAPQDHVLESDPDTLRGYCQQLLDMFENYGVDIEGEDNDLIAHIARNVDPAHVEAAPTAEGSGDV